jgi:hypothetical protein
VYSTLYSLEYRYLVAAPVGRVLVNLEKTQLFFTTKSYTGTGIRYIKWMAIIMNDLNYNIDDGDVEEYGDLFSLICWLENQASPADAIR